jgi:hypothetical protein
MSELPEGYDSAGKTHPLGESESARVATKRSISFAGDSSINLRNQTLTRFHMLKSVTTIAGIAIAAFMMPPIVNAAIYPSVPAGIVASGSMAASGSNLRNIILDQPDHRDNAISRKNSNSGPYAGNSGANRGRSSTGGDPVGGSPTPEPNSMILFAVGLSGLILLESRRRASKRQQSETGSN